jgi:hypothetical protein
MTTKPEVFIVESLTFEDEREERFEGQIIKRILGLSGKTCEYYYIRTRRELEEVLKLFNHSGYRYLLKRAVLKAKAQEVANMYRVRLSYFRRDQSRSDGYAAEKIEPEMEPDM